MTLPGGGIYTAEDQQGRAKLADNSTVVDAEMSFSIFPPQSLRFSVMLSSGQPDPLQLANAHVMLVILILAALSLCPAQRHAVQLEVMIPYEKA